MVSLKELYTNLMMTPSSLDGGMVGLSVLSCFSSAFVDVTAEVLNGFGGQEIVTDTGCSNSFGVECVR